MPVAPSWSSLVSAGAGGEDVVRRMADQLPHAVFTTDAAGRVTFWSRAAERITGWRPAEALGRTCALLAGDAVNGCACGVGPVRCGLVQRSRSSKTCTLRARDGRLILIVKSAVPLLAADGTPIGALEVFSEVGPAGAERAPRVRGATRAPTLVGEHPALAELRRTIPLVAASGVTVLVTGESGAGKSLVADAIHAASPRAAGPLVRVACVGLDARAAERAGGGTLVLEEVADLSPAAQARVLRFLELREVERDGAPSPVRVDARLVCTTHRDLPALVAAGRFRADLYFRIAAFPLVVPPLREHLSDLPALAEALLARRAPTTTVRARRIAPAALAALAAAAWPGNVRELENVLAVAALRAGDGDLAHSHLPPELAAPSRAPGRRLPTADEIAAALARCGGNRTATARALGISRVTLWKALKRPTAAP